MAEPFDFEREAEELIMPYPDHRTFVEHISAALRRAYEKGVEDAAETARNYVSRSMRLNFQCACGHIFGEHDLTGNIKHRGQDACCFCECSGFTFRNTLKEEILALKKEGTKGEE